MIIVHHLNDSRSQRVLWLLEELALSYDIVRYTRDAKTRLAPPELEAIHPLGKSPVVVDGGQVLAESGAIVETLIGRHGRGRLLPPPHSHDRYVEWLHFAEGSAMLPLMLDLYTSRLGEAALPLRPRISAEITRHIGFIDQALHDGPFLMGDTLTGADIMMSFVGEITCARQDVAPYPSLVAWVERFQARPAYQRALARGGAYSFVR